jgi:hypothetical protein
MAWMSRVPPGFSRHERDGALLVLRDDLAAALVDGGIADPDALRSRARATYEGRGRPFGLEIDGVGRVFVRPYLHGGWLGRLTGDRHAGDRRFVDELRALEEARRAGVPVCEPLGVVTRAAALGMRRGWLLLRELVGAEDVLAFLERGPPPAERHAVLGRLGAALRKLHDAGFEHPDLHFKNALLGSDGAVLVIDLDRVRRCTDLSRARRLAGLFRFDRYAAKQVVAGHAISRTDRLRVLRAYAGADWPERDETRAIARRLARHVARHGHQPRARSA